MHVSLFINGQQKTARDAAITNGVRTITGRHHGSLPPSRYDVLAWTGLLIPGLSLFSQYGGIA